MTPDVADEDVRAASRGGIGQIRRGFERPHGCVRPKGGGFVRPGLGAARPGRRRRDPEAATREKRAAAWGGSGGGLQRAAKEAARLTEAAAWCGDTPSERTQRGNERKERIGDEG